LEEEFPGFLIARVSEADGSGDQSVQNDRDDHGDVIERTLKKPSGL